MVTRRSRLCSDACEENLMKNEDQLVRCFICDKVVESLKVSIVMDTKLNIPAKLSQLVGEGYAVIISEGDFLCDLCNKLIASMDELQRYLNDIMTTLGNHLDKKYGLSRENNIKQEDIKKIDYEVYDCTMCSFKSTEKHIFDSHIMTHILESIGSKLVTNQSSSPFKCRVCFQTHFTKEECIKDTEDNKKLDSTCDENKIENTSKGVSTDEKEPRLHTCNNCFLTFIDETFLAEHDCPQESDQDISECFVEENIDQINSNQSVSIVKMSKQNSLRKHDSKRHKKNVKTTNAVFTSVNDQTVLNLNANIISEKSNSDFDLDFETFENLTVEGADEKDENLSNIFKSEIIPLNENFQNTNIINKKSDKTPGDELIMSNYNNVIISKKEKETMFCKNNKKPSEQSYINPRHDLESSKKARAYACSKCKFKTSSSLELKAHFIIHLEQSMPKKPDLICSVCNITFKRPGRYKKHMKVHNDGLGPMKCSYCGVQVQDKLHLRNHNIQNHASLFKKPVCELCHETFSSFQVFKKHRNEKHQGSFLYKCNLCDKSFKHRIQLKNHLEYAHRSSPKCRFCDKTIENLKKLREHEYRHMRLDSKTFKCDLCSKVFKTHSGLRFHKLRHSGKYPFFCEICGRGFVSVKMFEEHKGVHTKEDRYMCDICGKMFCYYSSYMIHRKWHDNPFPYKCNICNKKFHHTSVLAVHKRRVHTGERPYKCPFCVLSFVVSNTFKKHLCLHTQEFPYNCDNCHRGFTTKKKYATHLAKVHSDYTLLNQGPKKCEYKISLEKVE